MATVTALAVTASTMLVPGPASGIPVASAQEAPAAQAKTAYDSAGKKLADGTTVNGGDTITYAIEERSGETRNQADPRTLTDTMSAGQNYVEGSLTKLNEGNPGLTVKEPAAGASWENGQQIATFDPTYEGPAGPDGAGSSPSAEPVFGQNSQYVEGVASPDVPRMPTTTGDGFTPNFVRNSAGELIVWSLNHHSDNPNLACEIVGSRQDCGSTSDFWPEYGYSQQNNATVTIGTRGYMAMNAGSNYYIGGVDFANASAGWNPSSAKIPGVQVLANARGTGIVNFQASSIWNDGDKIYILGVPNTNSTRNFLLGCFDASTNGLCAGFSSGGNLVPVPNGILPNALGGEYYIGAEAKLPDGKYAITFVQGTTTDRNRSATYCVQPSGTTLVNCDGSTPVRAAKYGDSASIVPVVNANGSGIVPSDPDYTKINADRIEGFCVGWRGNAGSGGYPSRHETAKECFDVNGASIGNPYPNLPMYERSWSRMSDAFAYPDGYARVIYPTDYNGSNGGEMACYDFAAKSACAPSDNLRLAGGGDETRDQLLARGVTFLDRQMLPNGIDYRGRAYGVRMVPNTPNCFVTLGDGEASSDFSPGAGGKGAFLYWKMNADGSVVQAGNLCPPLEVNFLDQDARYCAPGTAGMTQWGDLRITAVSTGTTNAQTVPAGTRLTWYPYDPATGRISGDALGSQTVGGGTEVVVKRPAFLDYATTKNFTIRVEGQQSGLTYQFTQQHEADGNPTLCYEVEPPATCDSGDTTLTNVAQWTNSPATNETRLVTTGGRDCFAVEKEAVTKSFELGAQQKTFTAEYSIRVTNVDQVKATSPRITDKPSVPGGFTVTEVRIDDAVVAATNGEYLVSEGVTLEPGQSKVFKVVVSGTVDRASVTTEGLGECNANAAETPIRSLNNLVSMPGDKDGADNNWACVPVVVPNTYSIGDYVWLDANKNGVQDSGETGVANVAVALLNAQGAQLSTTKTGADGKYVFSGLAPGEYTVKFTQPSGYNVTVTEAGSDRAADSNGLQSTVTIVDADNMTVDLGLVKPEAKTYAIGDYVWLDANKNGVQDSGETGVSGVEVKLLDASGAQVGAAVETDADGKYEFTGLAPGTYTVEFVKPDNYGITLTNQGDNRAVDSNGQRSTVTIVDADDMTIDLGLVELGDQPATIGDYVWLDTNKDGIQGDSESGVGGITVELIDAGGSVVATTVTDAGGKYLFEDVEPGTYTVIFDVPSDEYGITLTNQGDDRGADSNGQRSTITVTSGQERLDIDLGLIELNPDTSGVGDYVWLDTNKDGIQDDNEYGVPGVEVILLDSSGNQVSRTETDASGHYSFDGLEPGTYTVEFTQPTGYGVTETEAGNDVSVDSNGLVTQVTVTAGEYNDTIDLGLTMETPNPGIEIIKKINGLDADSHEDAVIVAPGSDMLVTFVVKNTGNTALNGVTVKDDVIPASAIKAPATKFDAAGKGTAFNGTLFPGETAVFTATIKAPAAGGEHENTAKAIGVPPATPGNPNPDPKESEEDKGHADVPALKIVKKINGDDANTSPGVKVAEGEDMKVTFDVTNTGKVALTDLTVIDDTIAASEIKAPAGFGGTIKPGETVQFTATTKAPAAGTVHKNIAYAEGTPPKNPTPGEGTPGEPNYPVTDNPNVKSNEDPAHAHTGDVPPGSGPGMSTEDGSSNFGKCLATSSVNSPLVWLIPVGILIAIGGFVGNAMSGQFNEIAGQINAQIRRNFPDWGYGGISFEKPEWMAEIEAQFNGINQQLAQINPNLGPALAGLTMILVAIGATSAVWSICGNEGTLESSGSSGAGSEGSADGDGGSSAGSSQEVPTVE